MTPTHLAIVMEYASGGELFERICNAGRFSEDEVRIPKSFILLLLVFVFHVASFTWAAGAGSILLSATYIWSQLLPCNGKLPRSCAYTFYFLHFEKFIFFCLLGHKSDNLFGFFLCCFLVKQVCHRDLKLENTLLDGSPAPRLKICDFGYSKVLLVFLFLISRVLALQYLSFEKEYLHSASSL